MTEYFEIWKILGRPGRGPMVLSPLFDLLRLIPNMNMDQLNKEFVSWTWSDFGPNICSLKFTCNPFHGEFVVGNFFPDIVVSPFNVPGVFGVPVT